MNLKYEGKERPWKSRPILHKLFLKTGRTLITCHLKYFTNCYNFLKYISGMLLTIVAIYSKVVFVDFWGFQINAFPLQKVNYIAIFKLVGKLTGITYYFLNVIQSLTLTLFTLPAATTSHGGVPQESQSAPSSKTCSFSYVDIMICTILYVNCTLVFIKAELVGLFLF